MFGLDHIQLAIPEGGETAAREFWCGGLGLSEIAKPEALNGRGGLWLTLDHIELHLGVDPDFKPAHKAHPGFLVDDIDKVAARIIALGRNPRWDTTLKDRRRFFVDDPFGNRLEFLQKD